MSYFDNTEEMLIPLSIDRPETKKENYFTRDGKVLKMFLMILPLIGLLTVFMKQSANIVFIFWVVIIYLLIYIVLLRIFIIEEFKFKKQLADMEENKLSGLNYVYGISKIEDIEGVGKIRYRKQTGEKLRHGYVITYDTGSLVNVPVGNNTQYLRTKRDFLNRLYRGGYDYRWYEVKMTPETPQSLKDYAEILSRENNEYAQMVIKMLLNINTACVMESDPAYKDYIVVTNTTFSNLRNFKGTLDDIIKSTLGTNGYIIRPSILGKEDVEKFFNTYLMQRNLDFDNANQMNEFKKFSHYANIVRVLDADGKVIPQRLLDTELFAEEDNSKAKSLDTLIAQKEREKEKYNIERNNRKEKQINALLRDRNANKIDDITYRKRREILEDRYSEENYPKLFDERGRFIGRTAEEIAKQKQDKIDRENKRRAEKGRPPVNTGKNKKEQDKITDNEESDIKEPITKEKYDTIGIRGMDKEINKSKKPITFGGSSKEPPKQRPTVKKKEVSFGQTKPVSKDKDTSKNKIVFGKKE